MYVMTVLIFLVNPNELKGTESHRKQIIGTATSKSYESLITENDYELTADYCLKLPCMSHK